MAVAPMLKVAVLGYRPVMDDVVAALQRLGALQIAAQDFSLPSEEVPHDDERLRRFDEWAADAHFVREFLSRYHTPTQPFAAFVSEKVHLAADEFLGLEPDARFMRLYQECVSISDHLASGDRERARLSALVTELEPWKQSHLQISRLHGTKNVALFAGTVPVSHSVAIRQALRDAAPETSVEEFGAVGSRQAWVVMTHRSALDVVRSTLASTDFAEYDFHGLEGYPAEEIARAHVRMAEIEQQRADLEARARDMAADHFRETVAMAEAIDSARDALMVRTSFGATERAFAVSGWVRAYDRSRLEAALLPWGDALDLTLADPGPEDTPPVELRNPWFLKPFEVLTDLYGRPAYSELDPTPMLAPFFLLFFSICISDVGYGAMLLLGAYLVKTRIDVAPGVKKFMDLLMFGGAGSMAVGVAFGSYFALPLDDMARGGSGVAGLLLRARVLDPMTQLTTFLIFCVLLGVTQVFFGVIIAGYDAWRRGDRADAVFGQFSTLFLFATFAVSAGVSGTARWALPLGLVGTMLMQGGALQAALGERDRPLWDRAVGWLWLAGMLSSIAVMAAGGVGSGLGMLAGVSAVALVTSTGRASVVALLGGAYSVYGMSAFIGDILSYTRLAALGLSGALVGSVFNLLAGMVMSGATGMFAKGGVAWLGGAVVVVLAALVFVVGHVFNVVINLLGAFVHPARLQFVEFFSKFYEGGGKPFSPFRPRTKTTVLHAGSAGQEGGAA